MIKKGQTSFRTNARRCLEIYIRKLMSHKKRNEGEKSFPALSNNFTFSFLFVFADVKNDAVISRGKKTTLSCLEMCRFMFHERRQGAVNFLFKIKTEEVLI
jgi:hypothetical protein